MFTPTKEQVHKLINHPTGKLYANDIANLKEKLKEKQEGNTLRGVTDSHFIDFQILKQITERLFS